MCVITVCAKQLCSFQFTSFGLGINIEREILDQPEVVGECVLFVLCVLMCLCACVSDLLILVTSAATGEPGVYVCCVGACCAPSDRMLIASGARRSILALP
jgi:hypothetical protein